MQRDTQEVEVTILSGAAVSDPIGFGWWSMMVIHMPAGWTAADLGFQVAPHGFPPQDWRTLNDETGARIEITGVIAAESFIAPANMAPANSLRLWSQSAGAPVNQGADRVIKVELTA